MNHWFENWFDTNYYHLLYKHRDDVEAEKFISKLLSHLKPQPNQKVLDLACGRGRHSIFLNSNQLNVTGIDLSEKSISFAKKFENDSLHFEVQDMRKNFGHNKFDIIFNLFTSFGYFDNEEEDIAVLKNISEALKPNGIFVFDFLNADLIRKKKFQSETVKVDNIEFNFKCEIGNNFVLKNIGVVDGVEKLNFTERVKLIDKNWFEHHFKKTGLLILNIFGDYSLNAYATESERLIIIAKKNV